MIEKLRLFFEKRKRFTCTGCGKKFKKANIWAVGPGTLKWCPLCCGWGPKLVNAIFFRELERGMPVEQYLNETQERWVNRIFKSGEKE